MLATTRTNTKPFFILNYRTQAELIKTHPELKNAKCIYHKPRGMNDETAIRINVIKALERNHLDQQPVYQVGDFFWIPEPKQPTPQPKLCVCLHRIGDNGPCPSMATPMPEPRGEHDMPRQIRATAAEVQRSRAEWYSFHVECRQRAKQLTADQLHGYLYAASMIQAPQMTVFGGVAHDYPERRAYQLAGQNRLDVHLINPWYLSDAGWSELQRLWAQLPEPIDIFSTAPCVQVGELYTLSTMPAEARAPK